MMDFNLLIVINKSGLVISVKFRPFVLVSQVFTDSADVVAAVPVVGLGCNKLMLQVNF